MKITTVEAFHVDWGGGRSRSAWVRIGTDAGVTGLGEAGRKSERPGALGKIEISITPPGFDIPDKALQDAYAAAGVDRLILRPRPEMDASALERFATETGRSLRLTP